MNQGITKMMSAKTWRTGKTCARSASRDAVEAVLGLGRVAATACEPDAIAATHEDRVEATARSDAAQNRKRSHPRHRAMETSRVDGVAA